MTEEPCGGPAGPNGVDSPASQAEASEPPATSAAAPKARPFGPMASIALTIMLLLAMQGIRVAVAVPLEAASNTARPGGRNTGEDHVDGLVLSVGTLVGAPAVVVLVALLAWARRYPVRDYLALRLPTTRQACFAAGGMIVLMAASDTTSYLLGRPIVPQVVIDLYRTSPLVLLFLAVVIAGAVGEEVIFRGFLYEGIASHRPGPLSAILVSALLWAAPHLQYDLYGVATIAVIGRCDSGDPFLAGSRKFEIMPPPPPSSNMRTVQALLGGCDHGEQTSRGCIESTPRAL